MTHPVLYANVLMDNSCDKSFSFLPYFHFFPLETLKLIASETTELTNGKDINDLQIIAGRENSISFNGEGEWSY